MEELFFKGGTGTTLQMMNLLSNAFTLGQIVKRRRRPQILFWLSMIRYSIDVLNKRFMSNCKVAV